MESERTKPKVLSLFSGCGGLDLGFVWASYEIVWANDVFSEAVRTYAAHIGDHIVLGDLKSIDIDSMPSCDIVIGGPPCQSFSLVGKRDPSDPRGNLIWNFCEVVKKKEPTAFLMENVPGMRAATDATGVKVLPELVRVFSSLGYSVAYFVLNAADYGVPQLRKRVFIVGNKKRKRVPPPEPTHTKDTSQAPLLGKRTPWITSKEALDDLATPDTNSDIGYYTKEPDCDYQRFVRSGNGDSLRNHQMPYMSATDLKIIEAVPPGGNYWNVPDEVATARILNFKKTGGRTTTYGRLDPSKPAYTINTHFSRPNVGCNIHYRENRLITVREGLRLQSFPDKFYVLSESKRGAYVQVGNAVPPLLAKSLAEHLLDCF
jgi:DNA (cytosine-5)-methyltransferase 1